MNLKPLDRRSIFTLLAGALPLPVFILAARAQPVPTKLFIQVWFENLPVDASPDDDPGRVEISVKGEFVACALAPFYRPSTGIVRLMPLSIGVIGFGLPADVKVDVQGELGRLGQRKIKITEMRP